MSDQACKSEEQHRIDTLQEMANTEHQLRMARTQYESAKWELVRASEALLEWQDQWSRERRAVSACYPDAMPVDSVVEDARATMDRFCAEVNARNAALEAPAQPVHPDAELRSVTPATEEESGDQIGAPIERPWTLASAFYDGYKGRKHVAPQHPVYMEQWLAGDNTRNELTAEAVERAHATLDTIATLNAMDNPDRVGSLIDAQTSEQVDPRVSWTAEPEIPEGFTRHDGGECPVADGLLFDVALRSGRVFFARHKIAYWATDQRWAHEHDEDDIIAYRIIEATASEQDDGESEEAYEREMADFADEEDDPASIVSTLKGGPEPEQDASVESESTLMPGSIDVACTVTGGYFPELNEYGERPVEVVVVASPYAEAVSKGAITQDEADFLVSERERIAADEQAKFFGQGMMADADRHQSDQRSIVEKIGGLFKREKEDA